MQGNYFNEYLWITSEEEILDQDHKKTILEGGTPLSVLPELIILKIMATSVLTETGQWIIFTMKKKLCINFNN